MKQKHVVVEIKMILLSSFLMKLIFQKLKIKL